MGKALAKKLAEQGANVCIVARNQQKLDETIDYIKVLFLFFCPPSIVPNTDVDTSTTVSCQFSKPTLPSHQRRLHLGHREHPHPRRNNHMEQLHPSRHHLGKRRLLLPRSLHRHPPRNTQSANGHELLVLFLPRPRFSKTLAFPLLPSGQAREGKSQESGTKTLHHHIQCRRFRRPSRLHPLRTRQSSSEIPRRFPTYGIKPLQRLPSISHPPFPHLGDENPPRLSGDHPLPRLRCRK